MHHAVRPQRQPPRFLGNRQSSIHAAEIGTRDAPAVARPAIVASSAPVVRLRQNCRPPNRHHPLAAKLPRHRFLHGNFRAIHFHRRQEVAVRQLPQALRLARNPGKIFHVVVPGLDVGIANGPVGANSLARVGFEVQIAPPVGLPRPHDRFAADLPSANPRKRLVRVRRVRILLIVHEKLAGPFVARVARSLNRLILQRLLAVRHPAKFHLANRNVLDVIPVRFNRPARLQDQNLQSLLCQLFRRPPAGHSGANDDRVVRLGLLHGPHCFTSGSAGTQPCSAPGMISTLSSCSWPIGDV